MCVLVFEPHPAIGGRPRLRTYMVQWGRGGLSRLARWLGVEEDEDPVPVRSNVEVWFLEDDGGSSVQEFHFGAHNYGRAANWVLRDVLDNACGDARCCDHASGST
jgi:hypothetical protein